MLYIMLYIHPARLEHGVAERCTLSCQQEVGQAESNVRRVGMLQRKLLVSGPFVL